MPRTEKHSEESATLTAHDLMRRPMHERRAALAASAKAVAPLYNEDLAKPVAERELTAFTALDGEPILDGSSHPDDDKSPSA